MKFIAPFFFVLLFCCQAATAQTADPLPPAVLQKLKAAGVSPDQLFFAVRPVAASGARGGDVSHNARQPAQMASVVKLLTTGAALSRLGAEYRFKTELLATRGKQPQRIDGPLYFKGAGDPDFQIEDLWMFIRQLRGMGISHIEGPLVLDDTLFSHQATAFRTAENQGFFDEAVYRAYHAPPSPVLLSHGAVNLVLKPQAGRINTTFDLAPQSFQVESKIRFKAGPCVAWKEGFQVAWEGNVLHISGDFPGACAEQRLPVRVPDARAWLAAWFMEIWQEQGGTGLQRWRAGIAPEGTPALMAWRGRDLTTVVRNINKFSNNVMAQNLMLSITAPGQSSDEVVRKWAQSLGADTAFFNVGNGSGLSRSDRLTSQGLADVLELLYPTAGFSDLLGSLPKAGRDGTLSNRYQDLRMTAYLKTGRLKNVSALAGYLRNRKGQWWVWVCALNGEGLQDRADIHDILLQWFDRELS